MINNTFNKFRFIMQIKGQSYVHDSFNTLSSIPWYGELAVSSKSRVLAARLLLIILLIS